MKSGTSKVFSLLWLTLKYAIVRLTFVSSLVSFNASHKVEWCERKIRSQSAFNYWILLFWKLNCLFNVCFCVFRGNMRKMLNSTQKVNFGGLAHSENIKSQPWLFSDDTGHYSEVDYRQCTKILETVPNSGNFAGEPPLTEALTC